jgi:hypothetical protein
MVPRVASRFDAFLYSGMKKLLPVACNGAPGGFGPVGS